MTCDGDASAEWKRAARLYAAARAALRDVASVADVLAVHTTLREARFHLARAEAIGYDEELPTSSEPCWFDPQHGPATAEAEWPPAGPVRVGCTPVVPAATRRARCTPGRRTRSRSSRP